MKMKSNFVLRPMSGFWVVLPLEDASLNFDGMLTLNETGALLWNALEQGGDRKSLADALMKEYIVDYATAQADVDEFLEKLQKAGCLE